MLRTILIGFWTVMTLIVLSGCSTVSPSLEMELKEGSETVKTEAAEDNAAVEPPESAIQADLLYVLLTSEIAGQRGQLDLALDGYMKALHLTHNVQVAERAAKIAWFAQKQEQSIEAINIWLAAEPSNIEANRLKVGWLMVNGREDEALDQIDRLLSLPEVDLKQEFTALVQRIGKLPDQSQGLAFMGRIVEWHKGEAEAHYAYSLLAFHQGRFAKAIAEIKRAQAQRPDWVGAMVLESQILAKQGKIAEADQVVNRALKVEPENSKLLMLRAQIMLGSGDIKSAEALFEQVIAGNPENNDALFSLALIELQRGEIEGAKGKFGQLATAPKWSSQSSFYLGRIALKSRRFKEAVSWFDRVVRGRFYLDAQVGSVQALVAMGQVAEAQQRLARLRARLPEQQVRLYLLEGELLREVKQYQAAFDLYSKAMEAKPGELSLLYARALVAERIDRLDVLEADLLKILKVKPDDVNALNALGYTLSNRTERYDEAEEYLQKALKLKPDDAAILDSYGWLKFKKGQFEEALTYLRKAYKLNQDAEIAAHLGEVLWAVGQKDRAKKIWSDAEKTSPDSLYIHQLKERFRGAF